MKRILLIAILLSTLMAATTSAFAKGMGIKLGGGWMMQDYEDDHYRDQFIFGLYFDVGTFLFEKLRFRPSVDYVKLENKDDKVADVWGIHIDWYWFFLSSGKVQPFLGFGPALNFYNFHHHRYHDDDSDAGIEVFGGIEFDIHPVSLMVEVRYTFHDIAELDTQIFKLYFGVMYNF